MLGQVDLVMGSFSKTFASNGGFVATRSAAAKQYLRYFGGPHLFSNALAPPTACAALEARAAGADPLERVQDPFRIINLVMGRRPLGAGTAAAAGVDRALELLRQLDPARTGHRDIEKRHGPDRPRERPRRLRHGQAGTRHGPLGAAARSSSIEANTRTAGGLQ